MKRMLAMLVAAAFAAGCNTSLNATGSVVTIKPKSSTAPATLEGRTIDFDVRGLGSLADSSGKIVNLNTAGIVASGGGNIVAQGGGNIVASGGGNIVAQGGGNFNPTFGLMAAPATAQAGFAFVAKAVVHVENLDGQRISKYFEASDEGKIELQGVPDGNPLVVVAQWQQADKVTRRTAALLATGKAIMTVQVDPINLFVQARIKKILAASHKLDLLAPEQLKIVWQAFNDANVPFDNDVLADDATLDTLEAYYNAKIGQLSPCGQYQVKAYMATLNGTTPPSPPADCPTSK